MIVPSAPMVIKDDPTLMFTNAGMNQFKDIILGNVAPKNRRVADSQKCLRVSGKHNDLEEVGHDTYHHTMFEMLGNWSFGDYFKENAIAYAWEFLTDVMKLDKDRLYATVFEGNQDEGLAQDAEARKIWMHYLPEDRILFGNKKDNFWEMGDMGPCGPCSEIHIDLRPDVERALKPGRELVNKDHPLVIEIWNLVFMQYNRKADGSLENLPNHHVDTGMGFERLCMAVQGKTSNYDTDVFSPIIDEIARLSGIKYGEKEEADVAMRVVADHLRTIAFSIVEGIEIVSARNALGSNESRPLRFALLYWERSKRQDLFLRISDPANHNRTVGFVSLGPVVRVSEPTMTFQGTSAVTIVQQTGRDHYARTVIDTSRLPLRVTSREDNLLSGEAFQQELNRRIISDRIRERERTSPGEKRRGSDFFGR